MKQDRQSNIQTTMNKILLATSKKDHLSYYHYTSEKMLHFGRKTRDENEMIKWIHLNK